MEIKEFQIPVFWGQISVKAWGNEAHTPVLMLHGINDNAGSFDRLIPNLPTSFYYICVDLPGHGKSSEFPPNVFITTLDYLLSIKLILTHLKLEKCIFLGHSYGGQLLLLFTQLYPNYALKLITIDSFYVLPTNPKSFSSELTKSMEKIASISTYKPQGYMYYEAVDKIRESRMFGNDLEEDAAMSIADRCLVMIGREWSKINNDPRLSSRINPFFDLNFVIKMLQHHKLQCPYLCIYMKDTKEEFSCYCTPMLEACSQMEKCKIEEFDECHDLHLNEPGTIAPSISNFMSDMECKL